ncbi:MAG: hypothetical protein IE928_10550, partial [Gammaproteobacteria bacterium]|nr:hypothetical protein [Gammaproteobacteria bacterium]
MKLLNSPRRAPCHLALAFVMTLSGATYAAEPDACGVAGPSVFNVKEDGTISFGPNNNSNDKNTNCNIQFVNTTLVNVTDPNYYAGQNHSGSTCSLTASGITLDDLPLPSHLCTYAGCVVSERNNPVLWFGSHGAGQYGSTAVSLFDNTFYYTINSELKYCRPNTNCNSASDLTTVNKFDGVSASGPTSFDISNQGKNGHNDTSNYKKITVGNGNSVTLVKEDPSRGFVIEEILLRDTGSSITLINGKYGTLKNEGNSEVYFKYNKYTPNVPYVIDKMAFNNNTVLNIEPGDYYINSFENTNALVLNVVGEGDGSGKVRLYINGGTSTRLAANSGSCYNIK